MECCGSWASNVDINFVLITRRIETQEISGTTNAKTAISVKCRWKGRGAATSNTYSFSFSFSRDCRGNFIYTGALRLREARGTHSRYPVVQMAAHSPRLVGLTADLHQAKKLSGAGHTHKNSSDENAEEGIADRVHDGLKYFKSAQW